ncbi:hypothetical protein [Methanococcus voltae]|uniref:Uncharacterized protein n=1 Tax=Methanococcus voltae PS TaxID=523842 RepID=A0ABT2EVQ9_METVO|nr:hypothetical protein [Methanococcus voltae]MBP2173092.1 hypothetical protein [Methanococcus voltae]MCS3922017.1 hypothetical protein [Methanococcus voltae PS]
MNEEEKIFREELRKRMVTKEELEKEIGMTLEELESLEGTRTSKDPTCTIEYDIDTGVKEDDILEEDGKIYKVYYALGKIDKVLKKGFKLNEYGSEISYDQNTKKYIVCYKEDNECIEYDRISDLLVPY